MFSLLERGILSLDLSPEAGLMLFVFIVQMVIIFAIFTVAWAFIYSDTIKYFVKDVYQYQVRRYKFGYFRYNRLMKNDIKIKR